MNEYSFKLIKRSRRVPLWLLAGALAVGSNPNWSWAEQNQHPLSDAGQQAFVTGTTALKKGDYPAAVRAFQQVIRIDKKFAPAYLNLGLAYHSQKDYEKAIESFSHALELDDQLESAALFLGIDYCIVNRPAKAIKPLQRALTLSSDQPQEVYMWLGKAFLGTGQYKDAIPYLEKARDAYPDDLTIVYSLGRAHMLRSQQVLESLYKQAPHSYMVQFLLGQSYQVQEKYDLASASYRTALKLNPTLVGAHEALGDIAVKQSRPADAEAEFRKELELDTYNPKVRYKLGRLLNQGGRSDEALVQLQQAVQLQPSLVQARYELAKIQLRSGQIAEAEKNLQSAIATDPEYAPAFFLLGQALGKLGQEEKAQAMIVRGRAIQQKNLQQVRENIKRAEENEANPDP